MSNPDSAKRPAQSPRARVLAVIVALALIALGIVAINDLVVWYRDDRAGWLAYSWNWLASMEQHWLIIVSIVAVLVGLWFLIGSLSPRRKRYRDLPSSNSSAWLRRVDIARMATAAATSHPEVITASSLAKRKSISVNAAVPQPSQDLQSSLQESLTEEMSKIFGDEYTVKVALREADPRDVNEARINQNNAEGRELQ